MICSRRQGLRKCRTSSTDGCKWTGENSWPCTGCGSSASTAELQYSRPRPKTDFQDGDLDREPDWPAATAEATTSRSHSGCAAAGWWKWAAPSGQRWRQCASITFCKKSFTLSSDIFLSAMESYSDVMIFASEECCWCVQRSGRRLKCFHSSRSIFKDTVFQINGKCLVVVFLGFFFTCKINKKSLIFMHVSKLYSLFLIEESLGISSPAI